MSELFDERSDLPPGMGLTDVEAEALAYRVAAEHLANNLEEWLVWEDLPMLSEEAFERVAEKAERVVQVVARLADRFDLTARGWVQGEWGTDPDGPVCLHGAIRVCQPADATLIEQVWQRRGYGTGWNDLPSTTFDMVQRAVLDADPITEAELVDVFGPQWEHVVGLVRRVAVLTLGEVADLAAAWNARPADAAVRAAQGAAGDALWAATDAAQGTAGAAAWAATGAATEAARAAAWAAAWAAQGTAGAAAWDAAAAAGAATEAAVGLATRHLTNTHGYTQTHYDLLTGPWRQVIGRIHPDDKEGVDE